MILYLFEPKEFIEFGVRVQYGREKRTTLNGPLGLHTKSIQVIFSGF